MRLFPKSKFQTQLEQIQKRCADAVRERIPVADILPALKRAGAAK